jgi:hypothetical protein
MMSSRIQNEPLNKVLRDDGTTQIRSGLWSSFASLFASTSTLLCCALPALLVALGAGAALSSLISFVPQLVILSEYKIELFAFAGALLLVSGALKWRNRYAPCPTDTALRDACLRTRRLSSWVFCFSVLLYAVGAWFAFIAPLLLIE